MARLGNVLNSERGQPTLKVTRWRFSCCNKATCYFFQNADLFSFFSKCVMMCRFWFIIMRVWIFFYCDTFEQAKMSATISKAGQGWTIKSIFKHWRLLQQTLMVTNEWFAFVSPLHKFGHCGGFRALRPHPAWLSCISYDHVLPVCLYQLSDTEKKKCAGSQVYFIQSLWFLSEWREKKYKKKKKGPGINQNYLLTQLKLINPSSPGRWVEQRMTGHMENEEGMGRK